MQKSEEPPLSHLVTNRRLRLFGHIARSSPREDHHRALATCIRQVPPDWKRPAGRPSHNCNRDRPWPSELWSRDCLEKGHYSRRMVIYCGHSNAPTEYALKEESMHCSNRQVYSVGVAIHHAKFTRNARFYLAYIRLERSHR